MLAAFIQQKIACNSGLLLLVVIIIVAAVADRKSSASGFDTIQAFNIVLFIMSNLLSSESVI